MSNANVAAQRRFCEEYQSTGDEAVAKELLADDFVDRTPFGEFPSTKDGVLQLFAFLRSAFPDLRADGQIAEHWNVVDAFALMHQLGAIPG